MKFVLQLLGFNQASKLHLLVVELRGRPIIGARGGLYLERLYSDVFFLFTATVDGPCPLTKGAYKRQVMAIVLTKS